MRKRPLVLLLIAPLAGALLGRLAGPFFARADDTVQLSARVWREDVERLSDRTLESEAFRATGRPRSELFEEARNVECRFKTGTALFGAWCGLVMALKLIAAVRIQPRRIYEADGADCVACGRCFMSCPRERLRLKETIGNQ